MMPTMRIDFSPLLAAPVRVRLYHGAQVQQREEGCARVVWRRASENRFAETCSLRAFAAEALAAGRKPKLTKQQARPRCYMRSRALARALARVARARKRLAQTASSRRRLRKPTCPDAQRRRTPARAPPQRRRSKRLRARPRPRRAALCGSERGRGKLPTGRVVMRHRAAGAALAASAASSAGGVVRLEARRPQGHTAGYDARRSGTKCKS